jgi:hypothetical protein
MKAAKESLFQPTSQVHSIVMTFEVVVLSLCVSLTLLAVIRIFQEWNDQNVTENEGDAQGVVGNGEDAHDLVQNGQDAQDVVGNGENAQGILGNGEEAMFAQRPSQIARPHAFSASCDSMLLHMRHS